jgi:predicted flap endonuclease-1-like 5' DNA nuclease
MDIIFFSLGGPMFRRLRNIILFGSGTVAAILALYLLKQRNLPQNQAARLSTEIKVDEVKSEPSTPLEKVSLPPQSHSPRKNSSPNPTLAVEQKDDLKKIEGIGPKTAEILAQAGISSFKALSLKSPTEIKGILRAANGRGVPDTWPEQARLAAASDWQALEQLQSQLKGGLKSSA